MKADDRRARLGEVGNDAVDGLHHEVHVDGHAAVWPVSPRTRAGHGEVGDVMVVHHVEVHEVRAPRDDVLHLVAEAREIGGKEARRDADNGRLSMSVGE